MSHQTGITASSDLKDFLTDNRGEQCRLIKISIIDEKLEMSNNESPKSTWEADYDGLVLAQLEEKMPCYILYRLDSKNNIGYEWILLAWTPDFSPVREKMLYAATRSTLKMEFGSGLIKEELFGTTETDLDLSGYKKHLVAQSAKAPLTSAEEELEDIKKNETRTEIHVDSRHQTMTGLSFPISDDAAHTLVDFKENKVSYVQLKLDLNGESIELADSCNVDIGQLQSKIPDDQARYHLFHYKHTFEGDQINSIVFIYSMPGYKCPVKERMLYSSCKGPFVSQIEQHLELEIARKLEIDDAKELTEEFIYDEIHPKKDIVNKKFDRPKGPATKKGPRKLLRNTNTDQ